MTDLNNNRLRDKILAIDFGKSKVGLAFSEIETKLAFPLDVLKNDRIFLKELGKIIENKEINFVILGKPQWITDKKDEEFENLILFLKQKNNISLKIVNEMFTSKMAQENLKEAGKKNITQDDSEAARIMLQEWLDEK